MHSLQTRNVVPVKRWYGNNRLVHGITTRKLGNLSPSRDDAELIRQRLKMVSLELEVPIDTFFYLPQTHSTNILLLEKATPFRNREGLKFAARGELLTADDLPAPVVVSAEWQNGIDAVVVTCPDHVPVITTADCAPVFYYHPSGIAAIAHVGLIGSINQLPLRVMTVLRNRFNLEPELIEIVIGPSIRSCHYNLRHSGVWNRIGSQVLSRFGGETSFFENLFFDLPGFIAQQVKQGGADPENITDMGICTVCSHAVLFSNVYAGGGNRRETEGRFGSVIGIRSKWIETLT